MVARTKPSLVRGAARLTSGWPQTYTWRCGFRPSVIVNEAAPDPVSAVAARSEAEIADARSRRIVCAVSGCRASETLSEAFMAFRCLPFGSGVLFLGPDRPSG